MILFFIIFSFYSFGMVFVFIKYSDIAVLFKDSLTASYHADIAYHLACISALTNRHSYTAVCSLSSPPFSFQQIYSIFAVGSIPAQITRSLRASSHLLFLFLFTM